jgi:hypothetical protein
MSETPGFYEQNKETIDNLVQTFAPLLKEALRKENGFIAFPKSFIEEIRKKEEEDNTSIIEEIMGRNAFISNDKTIYISDADFDALVDFLKLEFGLTQPSAPEEGEGE